MRSNKQLEKILLQEQEREQQMETFTTIAEEMRKKGASDRSVHTVLTGIDEYFKVTSTYRPDQPKLPNQPAAFKRTPGFFLSAITTHPVDWLWQDRIPLGGITLLESEPGVGKSLLALHIAACVSSGRVMPDGTPGKQGKVILVAPHDSVGYITKPRLEAAGGDPSQVLMLNTIEELDTKNIKLISRPFSLSQDLQLLEETITPLNAVLVVIDSLDICRPHQRLHALPLLVQLAERTRCAILLTRPFHNKQQDEDLPTHSTAPLDLLAFMSSSLLITRNPRDYQERHLITTRHPLTHRPSTLCYEILGPARGTPIINWLGEVKEDPDLLDNPYDHPGGDDLSISRMMLMATLKVSRTALRATDLADSPGKDYENTRKLLRRMLCSGQVVSPARGLYTVPGHPCLAQYPSHNNSATPASPVPTIPAISDLENDLGINPHAIPVPTVPSVPTDSTQPPEITSTTPAEMEWQPGQPPYDS
jgi:archaellum biogenesis ATPase FlaH